MAGRISEEFIEELRMKNDIVSVVSPYVELKRRGRYYVGLCPFHNEKTPSFTVYPDTQSFYCFGCGAGGEIVNFTRRIENIDFIEAVKSLADKCGMAMPEDGYDDSLIQKRKRIYDMNREAAKFYHEYLLSPKGKTGLDYYFSRGYTMQTIRRFGLGFAPDSWRELLEHLRNKGYSNQEVYEANLAKRSEKDGKVNYYDNFRNKVIVPIIDVRGRVVAFGGRVLDDSKPKYINTSDTLVYKKSLGVFGLNFAKIGNEDKLIIVEGYMDVIALHQAGFTNTVAALGTAFTSEMAKLLSRYASEIVLCFDNDEAGREATERAMRVFSSAGIKVKVIQMSGGKDPDEIIKKYGAEKFRSFITGAANDIEYKILEERKKYDLASSDGKLGFLKSVAVILAGTDDVIARDVYASKISAELSVSKDTLMAQIAYHTKRRAREKQSEKFKAAVKTTSGANDKVNPQKKQFLRAANAEETLLSSLMRNPDFYRKIKDKISAEDFLTDFNRKLYEIIAEKIEGGFSVDLTSLGNSGLSIDEMDALKAIEMKSVSLSHTVKECEDCISVIKEEKEKAEQSKTPVSQLSDEDYLNFFNMYAKKKNGNNKNS